MIEQFNIICTVLCKAFRGWSKSRGGGGGGGPEENGGGSTSFKP